jgi:hypothetical protein
LRRLDQHLQVRPAVARLLRQRARRRLLLRQVDRGKHVEKLLPKVYGPKIAIGGTDDLPPIQLTKALDVSSLSIEELNVLAVALEKSLIKDE